MTKIIETEDFTVNGDGSLQVITITEFTDSIEVPYLINQTITNEKGFVDRESYKAQKEALVKEGKLEMERASAKIEEAEKILIELETLGAVA